MSRSRVKTLLAVICILLAAPYTAAAATYYVSPNGSDSNSGESRQSPWKTLGYATSKMAGGDTLIVMDGVYDSGPSDQIAPPSGSPGNYTVVKAQNDFKAILDGSNWGGSWQPAIYLDKKSYVRVEGLKVRNYKGNAVGVRISASDHIKIMRMSIFNGVDGTRNYSCPLQIAKGSSYVLVEDVWISGAMRYGVLVFKPDRNTTPVVHTEKIILRRVVVRLDYMTSNQPRAAFAFYGRDSDTADTAPTVKNVMCQNCIAIDLNPAPDYRYPDWRIYGAFYNPKITENIYYYGSIVLNFKGVLGKSIALDAFWVTDNYSGNTGHKVINSVAYDVTGMGIRFDHGKAGGTAEVNRVTVGKTLRGIYDYTAEPGMTVTVKNSIFIDNTKPNSGITVNAYNSFSPSTHVQGSYATTINPGDIKYLLRSPDSGTGEGGVTRGATIEKRYGVSGTLWGEPGYDQLTNVPLWPWPYEDQIKKDFSASNVPPLGAYPPTNDTKRGFCAPGTGLYGGPITLTSYIWEYLGNPCPADICTKTVPNAPLLLDVQ